VQFIKPKAPSLTLLSRLLAQRLPKAFKEGMFAKSMFSVRRGNWIFTN